MNDAVRQRVEAEARTRAGIALTLVPSAQTIDALVMASASSRAGEVVYTSDPSDLQRLRDNVPQFAKIRIERA